MQNLSKFQRLIVVIISNIIVLGFLIAISNFTYAQELHQKNLYEITKYTPKENAYINVGKSPRAIGVNPFTNTIYVANLFDDTVSVIDGNTNTRIGKDISVGKSPVAIGVNVATNTIYVSNFGDNTVSVIDGTNNTRIGKDIPVGKSPGGIGVNSSTIYVANSGDNTISVIDGKNNTRIGKDISVGKSPGAIGVNSSTIYVANSGDNTISVIDGKNNTRIGKDISVGKSPGAIGVSVDTNTIYVANFGDNTVSVIDGTSNTNIKNVAVGANPTAIGVNTVTNTIYVVNTNDNTVSVIDGTNNTRIGKDIPVGKSPLAIGVNGATNTIYVANFGDNTVSVIDGKTNKVVAKVMFNIEPFNAGHIECDKEKLIVPVAEEFYMWPGSQCTAKLNQGFEFVSWQENLGGNSSRLISIVPTPSIVDSILDFFHMNQDKPEATLNITKFGSFTANFKELPTPIPPEYVATLFTVVVTAFIGSWLTPTVINWRNAKKEGSKLDYYHKEIKKVYDAAKIDRNDINELDNLRDSITDAYTRSNISKESYDKLGEEISISYGEIITKEIASLNNPSENDKAKRLSTIIDDIEDMHFKGKINNDYYTNLKKQTSILYQEIFKKKIDSLNNLPKNGKGKLLDEIKDDISDAYSKEKISELHYTLLKEKLSNYEKPKA